jgi:hypothetical protein
MATRKQQFKEKEISDIQYESYNQGIKEASSLIRKVYDKTNDDIVDLALENWPLGKAQEVDNFLNNTTDAEYKKFILNFIDGMEDGFKLALKRWADRDVKQRDL